MNLLTMLTVFYLCSTGWLSQYAEQPTSEVLANRQVQGRTAYTLPANWQSFDGFIAMRDCGELGNVYRLNVDGQLMTILVFDCSGHQSTSDWMTRNNILGEIDYWSALKLGRLGRGIPNARLCPVQDSGTIHRRAEIE